MERVIPFKKCSEWARRPYANSNLSNSYALFFALPDSITIPPRTEVEVSVGVSVTIPDTHVGLILPMNKTHRHGVKLSNTIELLSTQDEEIFLSVENTRYDDVVKLYPEVPLFQIVFVRSDQFALCDVFGR